MLKVINILTLSLDGCVCQYRQDGLLEAVMKVVHEGFGVLVFGMELNGLCTGNLEYLVSDNLIRKQVELLCLELSNFLEVVYIYTVEPRLARELDG